MTSKSGCAWYLITWRPFLGDFKSKNPRKKELCGKPESALSWIENIWIYFDGLPKKGLLSVLARDLFRNELSLEAQEDLFLTITIISISYNLEIKGISVIFKRDLIDSFNIGWEWAWGPFSTRSQGGPTVAPGIKSMDWSGATEESRGPSPNVQLFKLQPTLGRT